MKLKIPITSVKISGEFIKLDSFLKFAAAVQTGGEAKTVIADGAVRVNGEVTTERGRKLRDGAIVAFAGNVWRVMSIDN